MATVVGITDGDTMTVLTSAHRRIRIRLADIDAPETKQAWGQRAKQTLSALVYGKQVRIVTWGEDQYGRTLGKIFVGSLYVNGEMVRTGSAWAYREYLTDYSLISLETEARKQALGLWAQPTTQIVPPWEWRHNRQLTRSGLQPSAPAQCGAKRYCRQMASCDEAKFYLHQCGVSSLDGDGDGIPCETICHR